MHKHASGIKVLWVSTLIVGLLLAGAAALSIVTGDGQLTTEHWMMIGLGSVKIVGASIGLWMFNRSE